MPLHNERPTSTSSGEGQSSDAESSSECCDSIKVPSDQDCSRDSFNSDGSSKHCSPSSSPPEIITLAEVMEAGKDLFNLKMSHEIAVNPNFHLDLQRIPQESVFNAVRDIVHQAYWDILEAELNSDPPEYRHTIKLLEEIKEILLSFINPGTNRMRTQIMEVLDMDLIHQQADNDALDIQELASYIITTMGKLCAPVRDGNIRKLQESTDNIVTLLKETFHVLNLMKMDLVNLSIEILRPLMQKVSAEYEREQFQNILDKTPTALNRTTSWIQSALEELLSGSAPSEKSNDHGKGKQTMPGPLLLINTAFLRLLTWDYSKSPVPETWVTDETRLQELQWQLQQCQTVNEVMLIVFSTIGGPIQGLPSLSDRLKKMISVLLDGMHKPDFNLGESLEGISAKVCCELNKSLTERNYPALTPELQATLTGQIHTIVHKDNPIRTLVEDRVQQYFMALLLGSKPFLKLEQVPGGLTAITPELALIAKQFISLVDHNRVVYGPFYSDIIKKLMYHSSPPAAGSSAVGVPVMERKNNI